MHLLLGLLPCMLTLWLAIAAISHHWVAQDFSLAYYPAAHRLLHGGNPYLATSSQIINGAAFVYPALSAVLLAPLALLSSGLADHVYTLLCLALIPLSLRLLGVRDWRVYGVVMLWYPIVIGWQGENVSVPLMFLTVVAWRNRERPLFAGLVVAAAISLKPLVWPLGLWLLATRRWRAAAWALGGGLALNLFAWGLVGFNEISTYVDLSSKDLHALWRGGYSVLALAHQLGLGRGAADVLLVLAVVVLAAVVLHQGLKLGDDRRALIMAVTLMLVASPLVWIHYFVLLVVPLAIARPRFSRLWMIPVAMWLLPPGTAVAGWQFGLAWVLVASCLLGALVDGSAGWRFADPRSKSKPPMSLPTKFWEKR